MPCPRAARINGDSSASTIAERMCRTSTGNVTTASPTAGSAKCTATSLHLLQKLKLSNPVEIIPPVGNHPVRTASKSKIKKTNKSGIVKSADVLKPHARSPHLPLFAALQIPSGIASSHASNVAILVSSSVFLARAHRSGPTGLLYENENPISPFNTENAQCP